MLFVGRSPGTGGGRGPFPGTETTNHRGPFHHHGGIGAFQSPFDVYFSAVALIWLVREQPPHSDVLRRAVYFTVALPAMCQPAFAK